MIGGSPVIVVEGIRKSFDSTVALHGVDLVVERGTVLGLLGRNGAGKSTLVRILSTLLAPDGGSAWIGGADVVHDAQRVRSLIGLAGQSAAVDETLTGRENLELVGRLYGLGRREARARAQEVLERLALAAAADRRVLTYSGGMRRRVDLGASLVGRPLVLIMDEPTTGLDPPTRSELWRLVDELVRQGTTMLLTTQHLQEAERLADHIAVLERGRVIASGTPSELKDLLGRDVLEVRARDSVDVARVRGMLVGLGSGEPVADLRGRTVTLPTRDPMATLVSAGSRIQEAGIAVDDLGLRRPALDDVFLTLVAEGQAGQTINGAGVTALPPRVVSRQPSGAMARRRPGPRRLTSYLAVALLAAGIAAAILSRSHRAAPAPAPRPAPRQAQAQALQSIEGISQGQTVALGAAPGGVSADPSGHLWVSLPSRGAITRVDGVTGRTQTFKVGGHPIGILASFDRVWIAGSALGPLASLNLYTGAPLSWTGVRNPPTAMSYGVTDHSACTIDPAGIVTHVDSTGTVLGATTISPAATSVACGEGWVWAVDPTPQGLVRMGYFGGTTRFNAGPAPVAVTLDLGVWTANSDGLVTVFDPRPDRLQVNRQIATGAPLDGIAAQENDPSVWAISRQTRTLYRIANTTQPSLIGTVVFSSPPVSLAVTGHSVWVAQQDGYLTQIRY